MLWVLFFIILLSFAYTWLSLAPWVPTRSTDLERINTFAALHKWQKFLEIGCGDAKVCHFIASRNPQVDVYWVELSPVMYTIGKIRNFLSPQKNLTITLKNLYKTDFSWFDVIYVFWLPETMKKKLVSKFEKEMKPNAKVISYAFEMDAWKWKHKKEKEEGKLAIHIYEKETI